MPLHLVESDITEGRLVKVRIAGSERQNGLLPMRIVYRKDFPPGSAGRVFIEELKKYKNMYASST
jgi:hypothetical protein